MGANAVWLAPACRLESACLHDAAAALQQRLMALRRRATEMRAQDNKFRSAYKAAMAKIGDIGMSVAAAERRRRGTSVASSVAGSLGCVSSMWSIEGDGM